MSKIFSDTQSESSIKSFSNINIIDLQPKSNNFFHGGYGGHIIHPISEEKISDFNVNIVSVNKNESPTSSNINDDIHKLVAMLTSESSSDNIEKVTNQKSSTRLTNKPANKSSNKLFNKSSKGGMNNINHLNVNDVKNFFSNLKSHGIDVKVSLNDKTMSEFFTQSDNTTNVNTTNVNYELESIPSENNSIFSINQEQEGGAKKEKKEKKEKKPRKINEYFKLALMIRKIIAGKLNIKNGIEVSSMAYSIIKSIKKEDEKIDDASKYIKKATEYIEKNIKDIEKKLK
jgi:hypothetical protein